MLRTPAQCEERDTTAEARVFAEVAQTTQRRRRVSLGELQVEKQHASLDAFEQFISQDRRKADAGRMAEMKQCEARLNRTATRGLARLSISQFFQGNGPNALQDLRPMWDL